MGEAVLHCSPHLQFHHLTLEGALYHPITPQIDLGGVHRHALQEPLRLAQRQPKKELHRPVALHCHIAVGHPVRRLVVLLDRTAHLASTLRRGITGWQVGCAIKS